MSLQQYLQVMRKLEYQASRINDINSINHDGIGDPHDGISIDTSVFASLLSAIGLEKINIDLGRCLERILASSFGKIFSFGLNTLPNVSVIFGDLSQLSIINQAEISNLGIGNYLHLGAPLFSTQQVRRI